MRQRDDTCVQPMGFSCADRKAGSSLASRLGSPTCARCCKLSVSASRGAGWRTSGPIWLRCRTDQSGGPVMIGDVTMKRREFLASSAQLFGGAMISSLLPAAPAGASQNLTELSAAAAVDAMRKGDIKVEDYAGALLGRAKQLESLNAFRTLEPDKLLEAPRDADKARAPGRSLGLLHGLPIPVKDSVNTKALPTSN